jgi:tetratricopeptide (TPR) repeat protein
MRSGVVCTSKRAVADHTEAIRLYLSLADAYKDPGVAYVKKDDHGRVITGYTRAIDTDLRLAEAHNSRAWAYFKAGQASRGLPDAERSLHLHPDDADTLDTREKPSSMGCV